jgi:predicted DNA-binding transcriptional regulator YafY
MGLGADVEVVGPPALRARMQQTLRETLEQYAPRRAGPRRAANQ